MPAGVPETFDLGFFGVYVAAAHNLLPQFDNSFIKPTEPYKRDSQPSMPDLGSVF